MEPTRRELMELLEEHWARDLSRIAELTNDRDEALYRVRELENQLRIEREKGGLR
jgi:hypothetical protein